MSIAHSLYGYFPGNTRVMVSLFFLLSFFLLNYGRIFEASYFLLNILLLINRSYSNIRIVPRYIGLDLPVLERSSGAAVLVQPCTRARFVRRTVWPDGSGKSLNFSFFRIRPIRTRESANETRSDCRVRFSVRWAHGWARKSARSHQSHFRGMQWY